MNLKFSLYFEDFYALQPIQNSNTAFVEAGRIALHHHAAESDQLLASKLFAAIQKTDDLIKKVSADTERGYALIRKRPL